MHLFFNSGTDKQVISSVIEFSKVLVIRYPKQRNIFVLITVLAYFGKRRNGLIVNL